MYSSQPIVRFWRVWAAVLNTITWLVTRPAVHAYHAVNKHFFSYLFGRVLRDNRRIYSIQFIWYNDSVYFHPMIWGSLIFYLLAQVGMVTSGWLLLLWFVGMFMCYMTIMYNINVIRTAILGVGVIAFLGACYVSTAELAWNPLTAIGHHVENIHGSVSPGFFLLSTYFFTALVAGELVWAWLFHRVEIDESYVYEHQFLRGSRREPIFASELKRETKDLLELLLLGAADIQHRTRKGVRRFKNIPFASLWLGSAIDSLLDHRRQGQIALESASNRDASDEVRTQDAFPDELDDEHGGDVDDAFEDAFEDGGDDNFDDNFDDGDDDGDEDVSCEP